MAEILLALAQFLVEALFPIILEIIIQILVNVGPIDTYTALILIGCILGGVSGHFIPSPFGNSPVVQALAVVFGPTIAALSVSKLSEWRKETGRARYTLITGWKVYWFCFPFLLARSVIIHNKTFAAW